ncbi:MAG TPA: hypothetical protein VGG34_07815 [Opitutaceae bacterium]|jgi:hypothetical protein
MTIDEAKFILSAYRPTGSDTSDQTFCEALRMAKDDPSLGAWLAQSRAHDSAVAAKLAQVAPPAGLRDAILAGVRVSDSGRSSGLGWGWVASMAAAAALLVGVLWMRAPSSPDSGAATFGRFAINDMVTERHGGKGEPSAALVAELQATGSPMPGAGQIDFEKLRDTGCRTVTFAGHDVVEVCFNRDGSWFHLYVTRRDGPVGDSVARGPSYFKEAVGAAAVWSDKQFDYAVASTAGVDALRRLL